MGDLITLQCPNCKGTIEFEKGLTYGFCKYCGTKVMVPQPKGPEVINLYTDSSKFYLLLCYKGSQEQYPIQDSVELSIQYAEDSGFGDKNPFWIRINTKGVPIKNNYRLDGSSGIGTITIAGIGSDLTLTKTEKVKLKKNGMPLETNSVRIRFGDLITAGNLLFRVQPMPVGGN